MDAHHRLDDVHVIAVLLGWIVLVLLVVAAGVATGIIGSRYARANKEIREKMNEQGKLITEKTHLEEMIRVVRNCTNVDIGADGHMYTNPNYTAWAGVGGLSLLGFYLVFTGFYYERIESD